MTQIEVLARWDARIVLRDRWLLAVTGGFLLLTLAAAAAALAGADIAGVSSFDRIAATLVHLAMLFVPLLGLTGGATLAGDRETGALALLLSQPVSRGAVFAGKYLSVAWVMTSATLAGFGGAGLLLALRVGTDRLFAYLWLVVLSAALGLAMLSVGFLIAAGAPNRSRVLGAALLAWLLFVILSDLAVLGAAVVLRLSVPAVLALGLLNPVSAFRVAAVVGISGSAELTGPVGLYAAERLGTVPFLVLLVAVIMIWALGAFALGLRRFTRMVEG